ncbi:myosin-10-like [Salvia hispanica]|uniref:myosin-10-like n=1 Tax=Salvia hispanica TaxID=49212 RepID=UPI0020097CF1|nr:myosin-10-like [Salvia hispanica]XP_047978293.1 myosin-10-like [Salvia hispanica]XP_047978294.1 myosin-10-like [Salvia hispanica]XP_047978295.1 myosin-10-like [Salvia hispanica]XP_047978296.1 myosin-10-like [Salvia hispanica]
MSRISKWKLEKTKVKVVFRLQFHATHIPQTGWEKLFITFIPADTGKPTAKTTKANVRNGSCKWGDPIYETTRLLQDSKSKQYDEKLYKLVVAMGSSRASVLGEATINLADYVDASKPIVGAFPLHGCNFGTVLHITVQLLTSKTGFREFEQQRELREKGLESGADHHGDGVINDQMDKVSARLKFKGDASELSSLEEEAIDGSSNTSGSLYAEKQETSFTSELDAAKCTTSGGPHELSPHTAKEDNELAMACLENSRLRGSLESAESSLFNLKLEVSSLQGVADELGAETQKLSHELTTEISSAEELAKEVLSMKSECLKFKDDIAQLKDLKLSPQIPLVEARDDRVDDVVRDMRLQFSKGISIVQGKIRELQKKTYDGDTNFIHQELETLLDFLLDFNLGNGEVTNIRETSQQFESGNGFGLDLCPPESVLQHFSSSPPVSDVVNPLGPIDAMKAQIYDLVRELDEAKVEKEGLTRKMNQMELYYEALIHELEVNQKRLLEELQLLRNEHTTCLYALSVSKTEVESLREETNQQMLRFVDERRGLEAVNEELERRATTSEAALRRARLNYSIAVDKLQKDLELLSSQVTSMFEANESLIKQALPSQPDLQVEDDDTTKLAYNQLPGSKKRSAGGDILLEDLKRSVSMQEDLYRKVEEELGEMHSMNLNLDIYSKALEQSLCEKTSELVEELKSSTASQNHLMLQLQKATDEIHELNEFKSSSISQCSEMALRNQLLEDKLASISEENYLLAEKLIELESTFSELKNCQSKLAACLSENAELSFQLKQEAFENERLKAEVDELVSSKRYLEESVGFVQDKLANLSISYNKQFGMLAGSRSLDMENGDVKDAVLQIEEIQHSVSMKNIQLMEENEYLKSEKASADMSLSSVRSEILLLKQKFKSGIPDMVMKLDVSNALVDRLRAGIESVANKLDLSCEIDERYAEQNEVLLADLALFEDQMQKLTCSNGHLAREISNLDSLAEEIGRSQLEIAELMHDKQELAVRLKEKTDESMKFSCEVNSLKEDLRSLRDKLHDGEASTDELERKVQYLTLCLSKEQEKLVEFEQQKGELEQKVQDLSLGSSEDQEKLLEFEQQKVELDQKVLDLTLSLSKAEEDGLVLEQQKAELERKVRDLMICSSKDKEERMEFEQQKAEMERKVQDLTLCLSNEREKLLEFEQQKAELQREVQDRTLCLSRDQEKQLQIDKQKAELEQKVEDLTLCSSKDKVQLLEFEQQKAELEREVQDLTLCLAKVREEGVEFEHQKADLERKVQDLILCSSKDQEKLLAFEQQKAELEREVQDLTLCLGKVREEGVELEHQKADLERKVQDFTLGFSKDQEKQREFDEQKAELERKVRDLGLSSSKDQGKVIELERQIAELVHIRERASHLELEKSKLAHLVEELKKNSSWQASLESQLLDMHDYTLAADIKLTYMSNKYETVLEELQRLASSEVCLRDLQERYHNIESMLNHSHAGEADRRQEKDSLLANLESLRSDLAASEAQNKLLSESNDEMKDQLEETKYELTRFQKTVAATEEEMSDLILLKDELEVMLIVLKGKVDEQTARISLLEGLKEELVTLRSQFNELSHKLAEQVLKTEEFKNLSTHLKELKDKAEAECAAAREKRENEVPAASTMQDSLRVAFIKEQYETKNQELKQQLSMSKKHGEEILMRLQDAIDEIETRKKSEAVSLKKNEELSTRLSALEAELLSVISEKREKSNAYDRTKAELECALLSLECCKEEKEKLGASLLEFEAQKSHLADELALMKVQLEDTKSLTNLEKIEYGSELEVELARNGSTGDASPVCSKQDDRESSAPTEPVLTPDSGSPDSSGRAQLQTFQDAAPYMLSNGKTSDGNGDHLGAQRLRSSFEHLHEELEKMKNENAVFNNGDDQDTQREIMQLHKANEELRSMFPLFDEISSGGNTLDRVLALEIELAEALKSKNKPNIQFQSSFLKQHSDEEAVFKSFRDINQLIKEMLELKGRHVAVEAELREMHDRYSQLSLQFAEVEGERQKLRMTLKNIRASKRLGPLERASSMDHPPPS